MLDGSLLDVRCSTVRSLDASIARRFDARRSSLDGLMFDDVRCPLTMFDVRALSMPVAHVHCSCSSLMCISHVRLSLSLLSFRHLFPVLLSESAFSSPVPRSSTRILSLSSSLSHICSASLRYICFQFRSVATHLSSVFPVFCWE